MLRKGCSRKTVLFAFGGGVTGDMAGFASAIFMRGTDFIQVPTTLLAMVDSSVGGKTGVNHPLGKNMIGAFHQPRAVIISLAALSTLPREEYLAGLAEVAKYAVIKDPELFTYLEQNAAAVLAREPAALEHIIRTSCAIKAAVVGDDEREMGEGGRAILNYGHTFGHAFEFLAGYKDLPHGLAVALGMRCAARLSARLGLWTEAERARHDALLDALEFPRHFTGRFDAEAAWDATGRDKKADKGRRVFILPRAIGAVESVANPPKDDVMAAFASVIPYGGAA
jgi:3-dehydroquinate synthase/shikimate kinase/3-dehydroquinate synthase